MTPENRNSPDPRPQLPESAPAGWWLGIPPDVQAEESSTLNRRLVSGDLCRADVDGIPDACVRPLGHTVGGHYRLSCASEA